MRVGAWWPLWFEYESVYFIWSSDFISVLISPSFSVLNFWSDASWSLCACAVWYSNYVCCFVLLTGCGADFILCWNSQPTSSQPALRSEVLRARMSFSVKARHHSSFPWAAPVFVPAASFPFLLSPWVHRAQFRSLLAVRVCVGARDSFYRRTPCSALAQKLRFDLCAWVPHAQEQSSCLRRNSAPVHVFGSVLLSCPRAILPAAGFGLQT
jgi:hypothetical protein